MLEKLYSYQFLKSKGFLFRVITLKHPPKNTLEIVSMFHCPLEEVIKTLLFVDEKERYAVVSLSGNDKVDLLKLEECSNLKGNIRMAKSDEAANMLGLEFGGITPFFPVNKPNIKVYLDQAIIKLSKVNIGSGDSRIGFEIDVADLLNIWPGEVVDIAKRPF